MDGRRANFGLDKDTHHTSPKQEAARALFVTLDKGGRGGARRGGVAKRPVQPQESNTITERAIWPVFISVKASLTSSSLIRREIISSSFSLPAM